MEWLFEREGKNIMRRTPFARATALIGRVSDMTTSSTTAEENRPERGASHHRSSLLRGHSPSVTEGVTTMSQEGFQLSSDAALPSIAYHRSDSPRTQSFFFPSLLVMSARMWKERTSDSQVFDSIQGNYSHFILSACHAFFCPSRKQHPHRSYSQNQS